MSSPSASRAEPRLQSYFWHVLGQTGAGRRKNSIFSAGIGLDKPTPQTEIFGHQWGVVLIQWGVKLCHPLPREIEHCIAHVCAYEYTQALTVPTLIFPRDNYHRGLPQTIVEGKQQADICWVVQTVSVLKLSHVQWLTDKQAKSTG